MSKIDEVNEDCIKRLMIYGCTQMSARPFSKGHEIAVNAAKEHLKEQARILSELSGKKIDWKLVFFVCSTSENDKKVGMSGKERFKVTKEALAHPNIKVVWSHNATTKFNLPYEANELWAKVALSHKGLPVVHYFYNSEDYGPGISQAMGAINVYVDKERTCMPISGTESRKNPMGNWHKINEHSRSHFFLKRYVIIGPEYSGKTKLAKELAKYFETLWVNEYAGTEYNPELKKCSKRNLKNIAIMSTAIATATEKEAYQAIFRVGDPLLTYVWYETMFPGEYPSWLKEKAKESAKKNFYFFVDTDAPSEYGRSHPDLGSWRHFKIKILNALDNFGANYTILNKNFENMLQEAKEKIYSDIHQKEFMEKPKEMATRVLNELIKKKYKLTTMESCTGGGISYAITNIPGASKGFLGGFTTYTNDMKIAMGVPKKIIRKHKGDSIEVAQAMAEAALEKAPKANIAIGITGVLTTPNKQNKNCKPGVVFMSVCLKTPDREISTTKKLKFNNIETKEDGKNKILIEALKLIQEII